MASGSGCEIRHRPSQLKSKTKPSESDPQTNADPIEPPSAAAAVRLLCLIVPV